MIAYILIGIVVVALLFFFVFPLLRFFNFVLITIAILALLAGIPAALSYFGSPEISGKIKEFNEMQEVWELKARRFVNEIRNIKNDPMLLTRLGNNLLEMGDFSEATEALREAVILSGGNPSTLSSYGKALVMNAGGSVTPEAEEAFRQAARLMPQDYSARYFLGMAELQRGNRMAGIGMWQDLLRDMPVDNPLRQTIHGRLITEGAMPPEFE